MKFVSDIRLLLLSIWLGSAVFFIGVAQSAFAVVPQRELAGAVVNRSLSILNYGGLIITVILIVTSFVAVRNSNRFSVWGERFLLLIVAGACAIGQFVIGFWMSMLRAQMGRPVDEVAAEDPLRIQFNNLHGWSEWVLMAGMAAALIAFFIISNRRFGVGATATSTASDPYNFEKEFKI